MKEFRGTLIALVLFLAVGAFLSRTPEKEAGDEKQIFSFEKHEVSAAKITRPDGEVIEMIERDGKWWLEGTEREANITMVNRIRHQLHDLEARSKVTMEDRNPELYGLGQKAIRVELRLNSGKEIAFLAGDPNPTGVSYYIQPLPEKTIYTVKKSALDYYSAPFDQFRAQHFITMDTNAVRSFQVWKNEQHFQFQHMDEERWALTSPEMRVSKDAMRKMIGRVIALKASDYVDEEEQTGDYGLENPVLRLHIDLENDSSITLRVGNQTPDDNFSYFQLEGDSLIYVAKNGMLEEFDIKPTELRNRAILDLQNSEITAVSVILKERAEQAGIVLIGEQWSWENEAVVSGSTPTRLVTALGGLKAVEFLDENKLGTIRAEVTIGVGAEERKLLIGDPAPMKVLGEDQKIPQRYVQVLYGDVEENAIVDDYVWSVVQDLVKEWKKSK